MYRAMADYGVRKGDALWLARAALNPSRLVASVIRQEVDSTGVLFADKMCYCRRLMFLRILQSGPTPGSCISAFQDRFQVYVQEVVLYFVQECQYMVLTSFLY